MAEKKQAVGAPGEPSESDAWPRVDPSLDDVNVRFHAAYDEARRHAERSGPVLVVLADSLVVCRGDHRQEMRFTRPVFHVIKSVAHAPLAIFALMHPRGTRPMDGPTRDRLRVTRDVLKASLPRLANWELDPQALATLTGVVESSLAFVEGVIDRGHCREDELDDFARASGPGMLRLTDVATRVQLDALAAQTTAVLDAMTDEERSTFQVVVTGDHQARVRSLGMQYFTKLLGEASGGEQRVAYGEGVADADEAIALVGTRKLDRAIASAFFGDPERLQRDVLGDAVAKVLAGGGVEAPPSRGNVTHRGA